MSTKQIDTVKPENPPRGTWNVHVRPEVGTPSNFTGFMSEESAQAYADRLSGVNPGLGVRVVGHVAAAA